MSKFTIYPAQSIITMNRSQPRARAVAVRDGRILGVGDFDSLKGWGDHVIDDRFANKVLMPGFVEGHSHLLEGGVWKYTYAGFFDRKGPDGTMWRGMKTFDDVVARLKEAEAKLPTPDEPLFAWGFDPIYFGAARMTTAELDRVSTTRPVVVMHANFHLLNANSATLKKSGITRETPIEGVAKNAQGEPTGELQEFAAMFLVFRVVGNVYFDAGNDETGIWNMAKVANRVGVTTATDLVNDLNNTALSTMRRVTFDEKFPMRLVPAYRGLMGAAETAEEGAAKIVKLIGSNNEKLHFGMVKFVLDGSIQGFTARLRWPGYFNGAANGIWVVPPHDFLRQLQVFHNAGLTAHIHTNGDEASDVALDAIESALLAFPRWDHRHTLQHSQMLTPSQLRRMASMGVAANIFSNHIYYWGDQHYALTLGPERAEKMDPAATALAAGVRIAIHSDAPVTPLAPLFTAWCAVNRTTASGRVLGANECIKPEQALHAITLGAAYTLKLDHEIGSIESGKRADFAILDADPLAVPPNELKDVPVAGTMLGGRPFEIN